MKSKVEDDPLLTIPKDQKSLAANDVCYDENTDTPLQMCVHSQNWLGVDWLHLHTLQKLNDAGHFGGTYNANAAQAISICVNVCYVRLLNSIRDCVYR